MTAMILRGRSFLLSAALAATLSPAATSAARAGQLPTPPVPLHPERAKPAAPTPTPSASAVPAPPAAPAAPAAPGGSGDARMTASGPDNDWSMTWTNNTQRVDARIRGDVTFTDDLSDVQAISPGGSLIAREWVGALAYQVEVRSSGGEITRSYTMGGAICPWNFDAQAFLATQISNIVRRSGYAAEKRAKLLLQKKGHAAFLDEVDRLDGDYVRRVYLQTLIAEATLAPKDALPVLQRISGQMTSAYDRRVLLIAILNGGVALDADAQTTLLAAAAALHSDYDAREVLVKFAEKAGVGTAARDAFLGAVNAMHPGYDRDEVLAALAKSDRR
jgi:hypothetical protein